MNLTAQRAAALKKARTAETAWDSAHAKNHEADEAEWAAVSAMRHAKPAAAAKLAATAARKRHVCDLATEHALALSRVAATAWEKWQREYARAHSTQTATD